MATIYPEYPDKDWDDDRVQYALDLAGRVPRQLRQALAVAGAIRHPERMRNLQAHLDGLLAGQDPRPLMAQVCQDQLGLDFPWPPPPAPARVKPKPNKAGKRKGPDRDEGIIWK